MYVHIRQVKAFMRNIGIPRGFEQGTVNRKIKRGEFDVPYIKIGLDRYFKDSDILKWLEEQSKDG